MEDEKKLPEAVLLGTRGGIANMKKYGRQKYENMAKMGWATTNERYGYEGRLLCRYGFRPSKMTPEERERVVAEIKAGLHDDRRSRKRTKAEMEAERKLVSAENDLLILHGFRPGFMTDTERASALADIRAGRLAARFGSITGNPK